MSVRFTSASAHDLSTTSVLDYNAAYTWLAWVYPVTLTGDPTPFAPSRTGGLNHDQLFINSSVFKLQANIAGAVTNATGTTTLSTATWYLVAAMRNSVTQHSIYLGTTPENVALEAGPATRDVTGRAAADRLDIGSYRGSSNFFNGRVLGARLYSAALTLDEIKVEAALIRPSRPTGLWGWWPLLQVGDYVDYSGNGRTLTTADTLTTEDNPPISWGGPSLVNPFVAAQTQAKRSMHQYRMRRAA